MPETIAPYGTWKSPLTPRLVAAGTLRFRELCVENEEIYWIEMRPTEGGRCTILSARPGAEPEERLPSPWNARSRVHEYGGGSFLVFERSLYFSHFDDGRVYRLDPDGAPRPLTPSYGEGCRYRFADFAVDVRRRRLLAVGEDHRAGEPPANHLVALSLDRETEPVVLASGHDFYAAPRISPDGNSLAWLSWDHPEMPWDGCELWTAALGPAGALAQAKRIAGSRTEALFQPAWSPQGKLHFVSDRTGWWNLYRVEEDRIVPLWPREAEFGLPQWVFGQSTYAFAPNGDILCTYSKDGMGSLAKLPAGGAPPEDLALRYREFGFLKSGGGWTAAFLGGSPTESVCVVRFDLKYREAQAIRRARREEVDEGYLSYPRPLRFPTAGGNQAYAFYYAPKNRDFRAMPEEKPPLIVISHGGPTGASSPTLELSVQYWTSRGFAVLDVNYGGSTGYGREYRKRLEGQWGVVDVQDCIRGAQSLVAQGEVDPKRLIIRGGSAGGYTTLSALTFHDVFRAGASYYGVGDIEALIRDTHKFESRYDHHLIGPYETSKHLYHERSPLYATERLNCPVILFQGLEDKVVPPNQAETFFEAARRKGLPVAYVPFKGEGHGFRRAENIERAFEAELYFYSAVFGFQPAEKLAPVAIENLPAR